MSTISNERLEKLSSGNAWTCVQDDEAKAMAIELLALRKERERAEPVAWRIDPNEGPSQLTFRCEDDLRQNGLLKDVDKAMPLYTAPPATVVPEGWKLVPIEPTVEMQIAFAEAWFSKVRCVDDCELEDAYIAMLFAAPEQCK